MTKIGGRALVGFPTAIEDIVIFNTNRFYGGVQLSHLFANWNQLYTTDKFRLGVDKYDSEEDLNYQPVYVLEKT